MTFVETSRPSCSIASHLKEQLFPPDSGSRHGRVRNDGWSHSASLREAAGSGAVRQRMLRCSFKSLNVSTGSGIATPGLRFAMTVRGSSRCSLDLGSWVLGRSSLNPDRAPTARRARPGIVPDPRGSGRSRGPGRPCRGRLEGPPQRWGAPWARSAPAVPP